jgi:hypothetical protein
MHAIRVGFLGLCSKQQQNGSGEGFHPFGVGPRLWFVGPFNRAAFPFVVGNRRTK